MTSGPNLSRAEIIAEAIDAAPEGIDLAGINAILQRHGHAPADRIEVQIIVDHTQSPEWATSRADLLEWLRRLEQ